MRWALLLAVASSLHFICSTFLGHRYGNFPYGGAVAEVYSCHEFFDLNNTDHQLLQLVDGLIQEHFKESSTDEDVPPTGRSIQRVLDCWRQDAMYSQDGEDVAIFSFLTDDGVEDMPLILGWHFHLSLLIQWVPHHAPTTGKEQAMHHDSQMKVHHVSMFFDRHQRSVLTRHNWIPISSAQRSHSNPHPLTPAVYYPALGHHLKVMTYNIWNYNPPWPLRLEMICEVVQQQQPHIIGWQEVRYDNGAPQHPFSTDHQIQHLNIQCEDALYQFVHQPAMTYTQTGQQGLQYQLEGPAIFSRYPIIHADYIKLSRNPHDSADDHQRVCLGAAVLVSDWGRVVNIFSTHLTLSVNQQLQSAYEIHQWIQEFAAVSAGIMADYDKEPINILMGDLNTTPDAPAIQFLIGKKHFRGITGNYRDLYDTQDPNTFNAMGNERKRIDFILVAGDIEPLKTEVVGKYRKPVHPGHPDTTASSDHWPVVTTLCHPHC